MGLMLLVRRWQNKARSIEEQPPQPMDGRSLLSEYPGGGIAIAVQKRREKSGLRFERVIRVLNPFRGS